MTHPLQQLSLKELEKRQAYFGNLYNEAYPEQKTHLANMIALIDTELDRRTREAKK